MQVAILAGGLATRLKPLTDNMPKSLVEIDGKPFLAYQLDFLSQGGVTNIVLCTGYQGEQISEHFGDGHSYGVNIIYSQEQGRLLGTAGALKNAEHLLEDNFFVMYGDSYLSLDFTHVMSRFNGCRRLGLMVVYKNFDRYDSSNVAIDGNTVMYYSKTNKTGNMVYIDYGISILRKETLKLVPSNQACSLETLFTKLIEIGELEAYEAGRRFYQIGSPEGLDEFRQAALKGEIAI